MLSNYKETQMKKTLLILLLATSSIAFAHNCPNVMKEIDAKMGAAKGVSPENLAQAKKLRAEGEQFHKEGKHDESMKTLEKAKGLLGS
jgi:hypothetical protein